MSENKGNFPCEVSFAAMHSPNNMGKWDFDSSPIKFFDEEFEAMAYVSSLQQDDWMNNAEPSVTFDDSIPF